MLKQYIYIEYYNWNIFAFYRVSINNKNKLHRILNKLSLTNILTDVDEIIGLLNSGYCYTNFDRRISIMIVNMTDNNEQMCNTIIHELNHITSHIEEYCNINPHGEKACYLIGNLSQRVFHFISKYLNNN